MRTERKCVYPRTAISAHPTNQNLLTCPALRLYPSVPINFRVAHKTTHLPHGGGPIGDDPVLIPRGIGVGFVPYYLHRRKDLYGADAHEYRPERWEGPELANIGWGYIPFHGGPRLCLGSESRGSPSCDLRVLLTALRGLCADGSLVCYRENHTDVPEYQVATESSSRTHGAGEANADSLPLQHQRLQGFVVLSTEFFDSSVNREMFITCH